MSREIDNGGAAFPGESYTENGYPNGYSIGMTLRDWFATHASEEDIRFHRHLQRNIAGLPLDTPASREQAKYRHADAMIAARKIGGAA